MSQLKVPTPPSHGIKLIAVASENMQNNVSYSTILDSNNNVYEIIDRFTVPKFGPFPRGLLLLATGRELEEMDVWNKFNKSDFLYFFIVKPVE